MPTDTPSGRRWAENRRKGQTTTKSDGADRGPEYGTIDNPLPPMAPYGQAHGKGKR